MALEQTRFTVLGLNPNDVATFLVVLILSLPVLLKWSKYWIWFLFPIEAFLIALLVGTGSRGGVLALICGSLIYPILGWRIRSMPKNWKMWTGIGLAVALGIGAGLTAFPKGFRLGTVDISPEASAGRRLEVWSTVPAMLASAANGWGLGRSAEAYEQWFEPVGEDVELRNLLSSHLTWLVEIGWPERWLYLCFWMAAFAILIPGSKSDFSILGVTVWTAFLVALFYNAAGKWWNWPLPTLWLFVALILKCKQKSLPTWRYWTLSSLASGILLAIPFIFLGLHTPEIPIHASDGGNIVLIGKGKPTVAILGPSKDVLGNFYGQEIRKAWSQAGQDSGSVVVVAHPDAISSRYLSSCHVYVISGGDETALSKWRLFFTPQFKSKLVLINCRAPTDGWIKTFVRVVYCHGEFFGDTHYTEWKDFGADNPVVSVEDIPGCEAYIADWWPLLGGVVDKQEVGINTGM